MTECHQLFFCSLLVFVVVIVVCSFCLGVSFSSPVYHKALCTAGRELLSLTKVQVAELCLAEQWLRATGKKQTSQTGGHDGLKVISAGLSPGDDLNFGTAAMRCFHSEAPIWVFRQLQFLCRGLCYLRETSG